MLCGHLYSSIFVDMQAKCSSPIRVSAFFVPLKVTKSKITSLKFAILTYQMNENLIWLILYCLLFVKLLIKPQILQDFQWPSKWTFLSGPNFEPFSLYMFSNKMVFDKPNFQSQAIFKWKQPMFQLKSFSFKSSVPLWTNFIPDTAWQMPFGFSSGLVWS